MKRHVALLFAILMLPWTPSRADDARKTSSGAAFSVPAGWTVSARENLTVLEAPEKDLRIAIVDSAATDADAALKAAWAAYRPDAKRSPTSSSKQPPRQGWDEIRDFGYELPPNDPQMAGAQAMRHGTTWTVMIVDGSRATFARRTGQIAGVALRPPGYERETFAGKKPSELDAGRVRQLTDFLQRGQADLGIPGLAVALVQNGKVVYEGGFGVRELGRADKVDADTLFMIGSNTKALTTLMLAKLVDAGKFGWDTPVTQVFPGFKLGDAETTRQVQIRHLICACTGMPRMDLELVFGFAGQTPESELARLATIQPTSKFGEVYQYSNQLAAAAGFVGGRVHEPDTSLGLAYDTTMHELVFGPLGMKHATLDLDTALRSPNHAIGHAEDAHGKQTRAVMDLNRFVTPLAPAGAAWDSVHEMAGYLRMELAGGKLPDGSRYISAENLRARLKPNVAVGQDAHYGMGLVVDHASGVDVAWHTGGTVGFVSMMMFLPEHDVGAVLLTNSEEGALLLEPFRRRVLEVLFDGQPEAVEDLASAAKESAADRAAERKRLTIPADPKASSALAPRYANALLGELHTRRRAGLLEFQFGGWKSAMASRKNDDGTLSFVTLAPGAPGWHFVVADKDGKRSLVIHDAQRDYVFDEVLRKGR